MKRKRASNKDDEEDVPCPLYGTQEYWEYRYQRNYKSGMIANESEHKDEKGHEWYFSYQDLKPLLLPIILGRTDEGDECSEGDYKYVDEEEPEVEDNLEGSDDDEDDQNNSQNKEVENEGNGDEDQDDDEEGDDSWDESIEDLYKNSSAKKLPRKVLEIGCGDVPLVDGILKTLYQLEQKTKVKAISIVEQIVAFDYSRCVIDVLLERQKIESDSNSKLTIDYMVHDATKMPYSDCSFDVIVDKGTLDAVLSDMNKGRQNCEQIISESARMLKLGGYLMIVSHLNANGEDGMNWLSSILIPGLQLGDKTSSYNVEVHGNDFPDDDDNFGPAVYIIKKKSKDQNKLSDDEQTVDVKFLEY